MVLLLKRFLGSSTVKHGRRESKRLRTLYMKAVATRRLRPLAGALLVADLVNRVVRNRDNVEVPIGSLLDGWSGPESSSDQE